jgi:hypothetical protein
MMENQNFSYQELIELYLDGQATDAETTSLFAELSRSEYLQTEFRYSLNIRQAAASSRDRLDVPKHLSEKIFSRFGMKYTDEQAKPYNLIPVIIALMLPFISGLSGIYYSINALDTGDKMHLQESAQLTIKIPAHAEIPDNDAKQDISRIDKIQLYWQKPEIPAFTMNEPDILSANTQQNIAEKAEAVSIAPVYMDQSALDSEQQHLEYTHQRDKEHTWLIGMQGYFMGRLYPYRTMPESNNSLDNMSIKVLYKTGHNSWMGLEAGQDILPLYSVAEGYKKQEIFRWAALSFQQIPDLPELAPGIKPFYSGMGGISVNGPIARVGAGLLWQPDQSVQFSLQADMLALLYRNNSTWYSTQKLSLHYGINILF